MKSEAELYDFDLTRFLHAKRKAKKPDSGLDPIKAGRVLVRSFLTKKSVAPDPVLRCDLFGALAPAIVRPATLSPDNPARQDSRRPAESHGNHARSGVPG
jgi:hypothetical protein